MFKILKDLAREPLGGRPEGQSPNSEQASGAGTPAAAPVNSDRLATPVTSSPAPSPQDATVQSRAEEDKPEALQILGLVHALQHEEGLMQVVEVRCPFLFLSILC